jgi:hypothetical protein
LKGHKEAVASDSKAGTALIGGKFARNDVVSQLEALLEKFKATDIPTSAAPAAPAGDAPATDAAPVDPPAPEGAEGGEEE